MHYISYYCASFPRGAQPWGAIVPPMNPPDDNPELGKLVLEVVENQIRDNDPPETRRTVERLIDEGYTADEARRLVSTAVVVEIFHTQRDHKPFNQNRFLWNLEHLPREPWDDDGNEFFDTWDGGGGA